MREILPAFDAMPDVIPRYAWFAARGNPGQVSANDMLITDDDLNSLGQYYNSTACTRSAAEIESKRSRRRLR
jgi:hypothetical protein